MMKLKDGFAGSRMIVLPTPVCDALARDPFTSILYPTDIGHFPHARYHFRHRTQGAGSWILLYCTDGRGWVYYDGTRHNMKPGQAFIIPPGAEHTYAADDDEPWTLYWVHFNGSMAPYFAEGCDKVCSMADPDHERITGRTTLFEELYMALESGFGDAQLRYACSTLYHFLGTFRYLQSGLALQRIGEGGLGIVDRCRKYMEDHIEQHISLDDLCAFTGFSPARCNALFKEQTGMTPMAYLQELRTQIARRYLELTDMRVNQVCLKVGVEDPYYFSRMFRKHTGYSPAQWRKTIGGSRQ